MTLHNKETTTIFDTRSFHLLLFFTRGVSLQIWKRLGIFDREVALYRSLQAHGIKVSFITYGNRYEYDLAKNLPGITVLYNRWHLPPAWYARLLPVLHSPWIRRASIIKTNQLNGALIAVRAARLWHKPCVVRCGYLWSDFAMREYGHASLQYRRAQGEEEKAFKGADRIVVTTQTMAADIAMRMPETTSRICIIPNYVDTDIFIPDPSAEKRYDLLFVGRLEPQKNLEALLEAVRYLNIRVAVIGTGSLQENLRARFGDCGGRLHWIGTVPHRDLPRYLHSARVFILPSHYEGHPKSLIEAMACGLPVIGADAPGIRDVVRHGDTGWLCTTDPESMRTAIVHVLGHPDLQKRLGDSARQYAVSLYSLERIAEQEIRVYHEVLHSNSKLTGETQWHLQHP
ncbi:MAG: glycosyltransferase family 4 protein [Desulfobacterota bacterium]|nr:glycosyltransferase family 4 protein [Thermodesulfobacteriota bacterium]